MRPFSAAPPASCDISDACDDLGVPAVRTGLLRPMWPECALFGPVRTLSLTPGDGADPVADLIADLARGRPGEIALVDLGGRTDLQCWGGRTARAAGAVGMAGALVNGALRDVSALRSLGLPAFAAGTYPARARGRLRYRGAGHDVRVGTATVRSGSAVAADADGCVFFAYDRVEEVVARARGIAAAG